MCQIHSDNSFLLLNEVTQLMMTNVSATKCAFQYLCNGITPKERAQNGARFCFAPSKFTGHGWCQQGHRCSRRIQHTCTQQQCDKPETFFMSEKFPSICRLNLHILMLVCSRFHFHRGICTVFYYTINLRTTILPGPNGDIIIGIPKQGIFQFFIHFSCGMCLVRFVVEIAT